MTFEEIKKDLKNKIYKPIYFFSGDESFFIDYLTDFITQNVIPETERAFNLTILYGNDSTAALVADTARRFPVMAERQVVIIKEAQSIKDLDNLSAYITHFQPSTLLVLAYKGVPDKRKSIFKLINSSPSCVTFESKRLYENKIPDWIVRYCKQLQREITLKAASMIANNLGNELSKVANELDKLMLIIPQGGQISEQLIEEHIGISKDFNVFELIAAISKRDVLKTNLIVNYFAANPKRNPFQLTLSNLFRYFNTLLTYHYQKRSVSNVEQLAKLLGINPYFIKDYTTGATNYSARKCAEIIALIRTYDMKSKGMGDLRIDEGELLKELIFRITH